MINLKNNIQNVISKIRNSPAAELLNFVHSGVSVPVAAAAGSPKTLALHLVVDEEVVGQSQVLWW